MPSSPTSKDADELLREIHQGISEAKLAFRFWRTFTHPDSGARFERVFQSYPIFSQISRWAFLMLCVVVLYRLQETRSDTTNFDRLIDLLEQEGRSDANLLAQARCELRQPPWSKVATLRNEVFAHLNLRATIDSSFEKAAASPDELHGLVETAKVLLNRLAASSNRPTYVFNLTESDDFTNILEVLLGHLERGDQHAG